MLAVCLSDLPRMIASPSTAGAHGSYRRRVADNDWPNVQWRAERKLKFSASCLPNTLHVNPAMPLSSHQRGQAVLSSRYDEPSVRPDSDGWVAIIDDHPSMRSSLARALRLEGMRVEMFASAEEYLHLATPVAPRCLVLDMQLPGMKGHELAHYLEKDRPPAPPTIFISAHEDLLGSLDCCASHGRLRKPFDIDALLSMLRPLL